MSPRSKISLYITNTATQDQSIMVGGRPIWVSHLRRHARVAGCAPHNIVWQCGASCHSCCRLTPHGLEAGFGQPQLWSAAVAASQGAVMGSAAQPLASLHNAQVFGLVSRRGEVNDAHACAEGWYGTLRIWHSQTSLQTRYGGGA